MALPHSQIPSVQIDAVYADTANATAGAVTSNNTETFALSDGMTLTVSVDGGGAQTVTFYDVDFDNIALATAEEVAAVIINGLTGATASAETTGAVTITSELYGASSSIQVTGGTANAVLDFPTSLQSGSDAAGVVLVNRIPEPDEVGAPLDTHITVDIADYSGTAPAVSTIDVYVEDTLAYDGDGTGFQTGFDGPSSAVSNPAGGVRRIVIDPTTDFPGSTTITVRVVVSGSLDESYDFTTKDTISPTLTSILSTSKKTIQLTFNESVLQVSTTGSADALNPANYTIERNPPEYTPAVDVEVVSVSTVSSSVVELTTDIELTFGLPYLLTVENVTDVNGNLLNPAGSVDVEFTAFSPDWPAGRSFMVWNFIPEINRGEDNTRDLIKFTGVIQEIINVLLSEMDEFADIIDPDTAPEAFLDAMLIDLGNPFTFAELSEIEKSRLVQLLIPIYKQKGTGVGIINVIRLFLGLDVTINAFNTMTAWILGGDATQGRLQSANDEPFALTDGWTLDIRVDDTTDTEVVFNTADFVDIGNATAAEVAVVISADVTGVSAAEVDDGTILMQRDAYGSGTSVQVMGGTAASTLGFPSSIAEGTGTDYVTVSELGIDTYLAVSEQELLYSFDIESDVDLTYEQRERIVIIADYMKPAHTHLIRIIEPSTIVEIDHLELGESWLGATATDPGTWILH